MNHLWIHFLVVLFSFAIQQCKTTQSSSDLNAATTCNIDRWGHEQKIDSEYWNDIVIRDHGENVDLAEGDLEKSGSRCSSNKFIWVDFRLKDKNGGERGFGASPLDFFVPILSLLPTGSASHLMYVFVPDTFANRAALKSAYSSGKVATFSIDRRISLDFDGPADGELKEFFGMTEMTYMSGDRRITHKFFN